jgi:hypothetical protein
MTTPASSLSSRAKLTSSSPLTKVELLIFRRQWLVAATQELGSERWRFSDPRKPVDIFMAPGDLAEEEVHGPATAQPEGGADALGNLDRFGDQLKLTSEAL